MSTRTPEEEAASRAEYQAHMQEMYARQRLAKEIAASAALAYVRLPHTPWRADDCHNYDVQIDGVTIGQVEAYRSESWGTNPSGKIRTHYYGNPKRWEPKIPGEYRSRVGSETRHRATLEVIEAALKAGTIS